MQNFSRETLRSTQRPFRKFDVFFTKYHLPLTYVAQSWFIKVCKSGARPWQTGRSYKLPEFTDPLPFSLPIREAMAVRSLQLVTLVKIVNGTPFQRQIFQWKSRTTSIFGSSVYFGNFSVENSKSVRLFTASLFTHAKGKASQEFSSEASKKNIFRFFLGPYLLSGQVFRFALPSSSLAIPSAR